MGEEKWTSSHKDEGMNEWPTSYCTLCDSISPRARIQWENFQGAVYVSPPARFQWERKAPRSLSGDSGMKMTLSNPFWAHFTISPSAQRRRLRQGWTGSKDTFITPVFLYGREMNLLHQLPTGFLLHNSIPSTHMHVENAHEYANTEDTLFVRRACT